MRFIQESKLLLVGCLLFLCIIPFFWLRPGEMDLGGDSSRLYFYDPYSFLKSFGIYNIVPVGMNTVEPNYYFLPFVLLIASLHFLLQSPTFIITLFNIIKLIGGFLGIYLILQKTLQRDRKKDISQLGEFASIAGGLLYVFSAKMIDTWDKALLSHNQVFLNPLLFYLMLRFFSTMQMKYAWIALFFTFIFSPNFALTSAPPFFAFYPLAVLYILFYTTIILKKNISWKKVAIVLLVFFGLHAFHLVPQLVNLFDPGSFTNTRVFDKESIMHEGIRYFTGVLPLAKASANFLLPSQISFMQWASVLPMFIIIAGFIISRNKAFLLTGIFFLLTLFLLTANITEAGVALYKKLFTIPGFSMFRNFIGQWIFTFTFFYAILFGMSFFSVFKRVSIRYIWFVFISIICIFIIGAWPFITGEMVNKVHAGTGNVRIAIRMDPKFETFLQYVLNLPSDGKILTLPMTDSYYQILSGENGGAYVGPSTISYLTDKRDFYGYQILTAPFSEELFSLVKNEDYDGVRRLFALLDIRYIFLNRDKTIFTKFASTHFQYVGQSLPRTPEGYEELIHSLDSELRYDIGPYALYEVNQGLNTGKFYVPADVIPYNNKTNTRASFVENVPVKTPFAYVPRDECKLQGICEATFTQSNPAISYTRKNPVLYEVSVVHAGKPYMLIMQDAYHSSWKLFLHEPGKSHQSLNLFARKPLPVEHLSVNGYANAWVIKPSDVGHKDVYTLSVENTGQQFFYVAAAVSGISMAIFLVWGMSLFYPNIYNKLAKNNYGKT